MSQFRKITGTITGCWLAAGLLCVAPIQAATFGRVVPLTGGATDIVLDERRNQVYLISSLQNLIQVYSIPRQSFSTAIQTDPTPLSAALSRNGRFLYVTCYDSAVLDVVDLDAQSVVTRVLLPARPEGVAVGSDGRVLITTTGSGTAGTSNVLLSYDPSPGAMTTLTAIAVAPAPPTPPTLPPPSGRAFLATHSQLVATRDGSRIVGVNVPAAGAPTVFVYESASNTVLRSRIIAGSSTALSVSDDGARFMCGPNLFDAETLQVLAQENVANAPYPISPATNFNVQSNQGGSVFSPDGQTLYSAFDISPVQNPPAPASVSQLMLSDPDNLLIRLGIQLPENLTGKMILSADGSNLFALSDSGFVIAPVGTIQQSALAMPSASVVLLTRDQCGVTVQTSTANVAINNPGRGRVTATAQLLQFAGVGNQASPATAPTVRPTNTANGTQFLFSFNAAAARGLGTVVPPHDFLIQSPEAINIPNRVRVYENSRDAEARGTVIPIAGGGAPGESFPDLAYDPTRRRIYIANSGLNRVEVFDIRQQQFLAPIKVGQLPTSLALTPEGNTLYVANSGGETISIVDPDRLQVVDRVKFPPLPFNSNLALMTPRVIAAGLSGPMILMSNGTLWKLVGNNAVPRGVSRLIGQNAQGLPVAIPLPSSMAATPGGEFILLATGAGMGYLYDATQDDFVAARQVIAAGAAAGYIGPITAGPRGQYFVVNGTTVNQSLVPTSSTTRLVAGLAAVGNTSYAIFSPPPAAAGNAVQTATPLVQMLDVNTGNATLQASMLEGPITQVTGAARTIISGRTMAVDAASLTAYVITASGLSIVPLTPAAASDRPLPTPRGAVNLASYQTAVAANGLLSIFGQNLGATEIATSAPLPPMLGGTCVTLNNNPLPLFMTSPTQINAQIPPDLAPGNYPLVVRSVSKQIASASQQLAISRYAPAVLVDSTGQLALFHADGQVVNKDNPANRDEPLTMYALGLGPTTGGTVTSGGVSPSNPPAKTGTVEVFFGDPRFKQAGIIVDWSGLTPGFVGLYQLNLRVPGFHISGDALLVTIRVGGVNSPSTGPVVPYVAVN